MGIVQEGAFVVPQYLRAVDGPDGKVHLGQPPGGLVALLPVQAQVLKHALMLAHKLLALDEHAAAAAAGVHHPATEGLQHGHQQLDDAARRIELPPLLAFCQGKLTQKILKHMSQHVGALLRRIPESDVGYQVDEPAQVGRVETGPGVDLGQHAGKLAVLLFDGFHGLVQQHADVRLLGMIAQVRPAGGYGHKKDVLGQIFVAVLGVGPLVLAFPGGQRGMQGLESIGDVLEEDQSKYHMLVLGGIDIFTQLVRRTPKLLFQRLLRLFFFGTCHGISLCKVMKRYAQDDSRTCVGGKAFSKQERSDGRGGTHVKNGVCPTRNTAIKKAPASLQVP